VAWKNCWGRILSIAVGGGRRIYRGTPVCLGWLNCALAGSMLHEHFRVTATH
jgi:hypothetical protein